MAHDFLYGLNDDDINTVRRCWFDGKSDTEIAVVLNGDQQRITGKQLAHVRMKLKLTFAHHPDMRAKFPGKVQRVYTEEQKADILQRHHAGEPHKSIADEYGVNLNTMSSRIARMVQEEKEPKPAPVEQTPRECLRCGRMFPSALPKAIHRICCAPNS